MQCVYAREWVRTCVCVCMCACMCEKHRTRRGPNQSSSLMREMLVFIRACAARVRLHAHHERTGTCPGGHVVGAPTENQPRRIPSWLPENFASSRLDALSGEDAVFSGIQELGPRYEWYTPVDVSDFFICSRSGLVRPTSVCHSDIIDGSRQVEPPAKLSVGWRAWGHAEAGCDENYGN